ncbi:MAG: dienelactone hydrolase family protein [Pseudomonadota bacterium]
MRILLFFALLTPTLGLQAAIEEKTVTYTEGETSFTGFMAWDPSIKGQRPGIIVVHEWWGHNEYVRDRARQLAALGYTAFAIDMYGNGDQAQHPKEAGAFAGKVMQLADHGAARFTAALDLLKAHETTDPDATAAIGYCFGGGVVLNAARSGLDLNGVVSFHGSLTSPITAEPGAVAARVLVLHGGGDTFIPPEQIGAFAAEMATAGAEWQFVSYPGVKHSFTSKEADANAEKFGMPIAYDAAADADSWARMQALFNELFKR